MRKLEVGILAYAYPTFDYKLGEEYYQRLRKELKKRVKKENLVSKINFDFVDKLILTEEDNLSAVRKFKDSAVDIIMVVNATFSDGSFIVELAENFPNIPFVQWAFPEPESQTDVIKLNSICGANVNTSFLKRLNINYKYFYSEPEEDAKIEKLFALFQAVMLDKKLKKSKICLVGNRAPGFYLSNVNELRFRKEIGPRLSHLSLSTFIKKIEEIKKEDLLVEVEKMKKEVDLITTTEEMLKKQQQPTYI